MADDIPAGWYPDAHGTTRWWDGQRWTDHVRDASRPTPEAPQPATPVQPATPTEPAAIEATVEPVTVEPVVAAVPPAPTVPPAPVVTPQPVVQAAPTTVIPVQPTQATQAPEIHRPNTRISYPKTAEDEIEEEDDTGRRRYWLVTTAIALATFFLGMGLGGQTAQPRQASDPLPPAVGTEPSDVEALRQQLADRQAELDERQQVLDEREADLEDRASEPSPSPSPSTDTPTPNATATTINGDDTVQFGYDVREGTYRTAGPANADYECEYTISRDEFGDDVISSDTATSGTSVTLRDGDWFESDDCQDWERD